MRTSRVVAAALAGALSLAACGSGIPEQPIRTGAPQEIPTPLPAPTPIGGAEAEG